MRSFRCPALPLRGVVVMLLATVALPAALLAKPSNAQPARAAAPAAPASAPTGATTQDAASPVPQQTTATFSDWTLRCTHPAGAAPVCEIAQGINNGDHAVAQIAIGRLARGQPNRMVVLVPTNVSLASPALLTAAPAAAHAAEAPALTLAWRRCVPGNCMAEADLTDDLLASLRRWTEPGKITFLDGNGQAAALPFSPKGLAPALDALAKETGF